MLLSESEAFWMAFVYHKVRGLLGSHTAGTDDRPETAGDDNIAPPPKSATSEDASTQVAPEHGRSTGIAVYDAIHTLAVGFGVTSTARVEAGDATKTVSPPPDIKWGVVLAPLTGQEACEVLQRLRHQHQQTAADFTAAGRTDAELRDFEEWASKTLSSFIAGYAKSTPGVIYGLSASGEAYVQTSAQQRARGLYQSLMVLLADSVPLPVRERLVMEMGGYSDRILGLLAVPTAHCVDLYLGGLDADIALGHLEGLEQSNRNSIAWQIGSQLFELESQIQEIIEDQELWCHVLGGDGDASDDSDDGAADKCTSESSADDFETGDARPSIDATVQAEINRIFKLHRTDMAAELIPLFRRLFLSESFQEDSDAPDMDAIYEEFEFAAFHDVAEVARQCSATCRAHGLDPVAELLEEAAAKMPTRGAAGMLYVVAKNNRQFGSQTLLDDMRNTAALVSGAAKIAYGELRFRELKWDDSTLPAPALTGWAGQTDNIREVIRVAIEQLDNGVRPYVVLTQISPAAEALVRQIGSKHLESFQGVNPSGILHRLRQQLRDVESDSNLSLQVSIAQSLITLRNRVLHEPDARWERDHAAFFIRGLSLLLSEL